MGRGKQSPGLDLSGVGRKRFNLNNKPGASFSFGGGGGRGSQGPAPVRKRNLVLIVLAVIVALALVIGAGVFAYRQSVQNALKPTVDTAEISSVLSQEVEDSIQWDLLVIENGTQSESDPEGVSSVALVAVDSSNLKLSFIWIPPTLRLYVAGYGYQSLSESSASLGDSGTLQAIADATGVQINHYFKASVPGIDKYCSDTGIDSSSSKENIAKAIVKKIVESSSEQASTQVSQLDNYVAGDMSKDSEVSLFTSLKGIDSSKKIFNEDMPLEEEQTEEGYTQIKTDEWATMLKRLDSGLDPVANNAEINESNDIRENYKVTIWNGAGVSGIASDCSKYLESKGWTMESTGNAASFVYDETLIVYTYDSDQKAAELMVSDLGQGRAVRSAARYNFDGDLLVVVGKDYQPF